MHREVHIYQRPVHNDVRIQITPNAKTETIDGYQYVSISLVDAHALFVDLQEALFGDEE